MNAHAGNVDISVWRDLPEVSVEKEKLEIRKLNLEIRKWEFENGNQGFETKRGSENDEESSKSPPLPQVGADAAGKDGHPPVPGEASPPIV
jgi:hypothetical protein